MKSFGSLGLGEVYLLKAVGKMRTFWSGLVAICGLFLLFLAAGLALPGRALPGYAVEAQHFKKTISMAEIFGLPSHLYSNSLSVHPEVCGLGLMESFVNKEVSR